MRIYPFAKWSSIGLSILILLAGGVSQTLHAQVSVTISPALVTLATLATQQFTATVTGTTNSAVTWQVNGAAGGSSTAGLVSTNGLYFGPQAVPSPASLSVTAVSQADPTKSASATVTVQLPSRSGVIHYVSTTGSDTNAGTECGHHDRDRHSAGPMGPHATESHVLPPRIGHPRS